MDRNLLHKLNVPQTVIRPWLLVVLLMLTASVEAAELHTPRYFISRIENFVRANAWSEAKREINEGLSEYPDDPDLRYFNGRYYFLSGDIEKARYNLVRAIQTDEMHFRAKRQLVDVEDKLKHYSSAICYINELLEYQPYDRDLWRRKIGMFRKMGNTVEADAALQRLSQIYPNDSIVANEVRKRNRENWNNMLHRSNNTQAANDLEEWIDKDPKNLEFYIELVNVYEHMGEYDRALGAANRGLVHFPGNNILVNKAIGLMTNRGLYNQALAFAKEHHVDRLHDYLLQEVANNARMNDPYEANGRLYAATHDRDALHYLINTALTRGYYDDARVYLSDAMRNDGRTASLLMKQYDLEQKCGNERAAIKILEELYTKDPDDEELIERYASLMLLLGNRETEGEQWVEAQRHLTRALDLITPDQEQWPAAVSRLITVLGHQGKYNEARDLYLESAARTDKETAQRLASAYESLMANRLRQLVEDEAYEKALAEAQNLLDVIPTCEPALRTCINMSQTLHRNELFQDYALQGYKQHPDVPYFIVKYALSLQQQKRSAEALELLRPRQDNDDWVNPQLIAAYSGIADEWSNELIRSHMNDLAMQVLDTALVYDPTNKELLYAKGLIYERMKEYGKAYELQNRNYDPSNAEQKEWMEHMRYLRYRSFRNRIDASYTTAFYDTQQEGLGSTAHLYSIASIAYSRLWKRDTFTGQISYKGIDGYHIESATAPTENESGGVGLEFMGQWEHTFNHRWSGMANVAAATRYFNHVGVNVQAIYAANHNWTPSLKLGYRLTPDTYLYMGNGTSTLARQEKLNLFIMSPAVTKAWERISVTGSIDLTAMESGLYYNIGAKGKFLINDDNVSSVTLLAGFGSFPELQFFDQTALQGISHTNAMIGIDAQYLVTRNLCIGLTGNWNTCYDPYRLSDGTLTDHYRNIFSITAQVHLAF